MSGEDTAAMDPGTNEFYRQWITVQRPQITRDLHPSHVVYCMPHFSDLLSDLMKSERQNLAEAANLFVDKLLERSHRPGWYTEFVDALQSAGYEKLVKLLSFKDVKCDNVFRQLISLVMPVLVIIRPMEIMPILVEKGVISDIDMDEIQHLETSFSRHSAMAELLCRLPKHREDWFHAFAIALRKTNNNIPLKSLEPMLTTAKSDESIQRILNDLQLGNSEEFESDPGKLKKLQSSDSSLAEDGEGSVITNQLEYKESGEPLLEVNAPNVLNNLNLGFTEEKNYDKDQKLLGITMATGQASTAPTKPVAMATRFPQAGCSTSCTGQNQETSPKQIGRDGQQRSTTHSMRPIQSEADDVAQEFVYTRNDFTNDREDQDYSMNENFISLRTEGVPSGSFVQGHHQANPGDQRSNGSCNESFVSLYSMTSTSEPGEERQLVPNTILIGNFPTGVDMDTIVEHFGMIGDIQLNPQGKPKIRLLRNRTTNEYKGQALITYSNDMYANAAVEIFNDTEFERNLIKVAIARKKIRQSSARASSPERTIMPDLDLQEGDSTLRPPAEDNATSPSGVDESHAELKLRGYQEELAAKAKMGRNCVIVAPTGSGKTHVAMEIIRNHVVQMRRRNKTPTIVFFVPTVALVEQQRKQFVRYLSNCKILGLSGDQDAKLPLSELLPINDIIVLTPQILENALKEKDIGTVSVLSLIIFDECHHTNKGHPYNMIMSHYIDEKLKHASNRRNLPQVVGLTASVGVGKSKTKDQAVQCILKLCANLDATEICTVKSSLDELTKHVNRPGEDTKEISGRRDDPFFDSINIIMSKIEAKMKNSESSKLVLLENGEFTQQLQAPAERGGDRYTQWISRLQKSVHAIQNQPARRFYVSCLSAVQIYNTALLINADCRTKDAIDYIVKELNPEKVDDLHKFQDATDDWLKQLFEDEKASLEELSKDPKYENPKLNCLKDIIRGKYSNAPDSRVIVFCKTREMTVALVNWMKDTEELRKFNPHGLVGTNAPSDKAGMTQVKQVDVLEKFKTGDHKLIVATSVAEEGLDVQKCNIVIRYEHVTNQIARVQSRGRARADNAQYLVVAEKGRGAAEKEESNKIREKMMQKAIDVINELDVKQRCKEIDKYQREAQVEREMAKKGKEISKLLKSSKNTDEPVYELRCRKCDSFSTSSNHIRKIEASHHVILDPEYNDRIKIRPHPAPKCFENFELTGKIFCRRCHLQWGIMAFYKKVSFPVVKVGSLIVIKDGGEQKVCNRWKEVPFTVKILSPDDLQVMVERHQQNEQHQIELIGDVEIPSYDDQSSDDDSMYE